MVSRFLEKSVEIEPDDVFLVGAGPMELKYYLLVSEDYNINTEEIHKTYGIEIVKKSSGLNDEKKEYSDVFTNREKVKSLIKILADNTVTPLSLPYVLDDLLGL